MRLQEGERYTPQAQARAERAEARERKLLTNCNNDAHTFHIIGIGDVSIAKDLGHAAKQYCICPVADADTCQKTCKEI